MRLPSGKRASEDGHGRLHNRLNPIQDGLFELTKPTKVASLMAVPGG